MWYHFFGIVSSSLFVLSILGLSLQLRTIVTRRLALRRSSLQSASGATDMLLLNRLISSFLCFYSVLVYGLLLERTDWYLAASRVTAVLLALWILFEVMIDRRTVSAIIAFILTAASMFLPICIVAFDIKNDALRTLSQYMLVACAVLLSQGYVHQARSVLQTRSAGAINHHSHQLYLAKDASTCLFALTLGTAAGWPLLLLCGVSPFCQTYLLCALRVIKSSAPAPYPH